VWINSLAIGVAVGVTAYLADGLLDTIMMGLLAFVVSFAVFDLLARNGRGGPDDAC
jgi:hypothetical protein